MFAVRPKPPTCSTRNPGIVRSESTKVISARSRISRPSITLTVFETCSIGCSASAETVTVSRIVGVGVGVAVCANERPANKKIKKNFIFFLFCPSQNGSSQDKRAKFQTYRLWILDCRFWIESKIQNLKSKIDSLLRGQRRIHTGLPSRRLSKNGTPVSGRPFPNKRSPP